MHNAFDSFVKEAGMSDKAANHILLKSLIQRREFTKAVQLAQSQMSQTRNVDLSACKI